MNSYIDLCIIASTADKRFEIIRALLAISKVRNMLLEKVLFQNLSEYDIIDKLLLEDEDYTVSKTMLQRIKDISKIMRQIMLQKEKGAREQKNVFGGSNKMKHERSI